MDLSNWPKSEFEYGRRGLNSGLEGARSGEEAFLNGISLTPFIGDAVRKALKPAGVVAVVGMLSGYRGNGHSSLGRILGFGFLGSLIGFASGLAWPEHRPVHRLNHQRLALFDFGELSHGALTISPPQQESPARRSRRVTGGAIAGGI